MEPTERPQAKDGEEAAAVREQDQDTRVSGPDRAVDHERTPGVPPPSNDDLEDPVDHQSGESFPASDPPSGW